MSLGALFRLFRELVTRGVWHLGFALTHLMPRRPDLWAFGSWQGQRFADNARYLFLYATSLPEPKPRCVWISANRSVVEHLREAGFPAYRKWSVRGLWTALRAAVYVYDMRSSDISYALSGGAVRVNLWHGVPLKRIERDIEDPQHPLNKARYGSLATRLIHSWVDPQIYEHADYLVATGPDPATFFQSAFAVKPSAVLRTGYPRNDALFGQAWARRALGPEDVAISEQLERDRAAGYRVVGYFPTWRDITLVRGGLFQVPLPLGDLDRVLERYRTKLYCKLHQSSRAVLENMEELESCEHIELLPSDVDIYQQLPLMDALITDYSSVYFDYLLLERPIIFYAPDLDEYQRYRTFYYDYEDATPGPKAYDAEQLVCALENVLADYDHATEAWRADRHRVGEAVHSFFDGNSSKRCYEAIVERFGSGPPADPSGGG